MSPFRIRKKNFKRLRILLHGAVSGNLFSTEFVFPPAANVMECRIGNERREVIRMARAGEAGNKVNRGPFQEEEKLPLATAARGFTAIVNTLITATLQKT